MDFAFLYQTDQSKIFRIMARQRNRRIQSGSKLFGSFDARLTSTVEERGCLGSLNKHISKSSGNKINRRNQPGLLYLTRLHKYIGAWRILKSIWRFFFCRRGKTIHCMGTPETIQVFEDILGDLPVVEIYQYANKVRSGLRPLGTHSIST